MPGGLSDPRGDGGCPVPSSFQRQGEGAASTRSSLKIKLRRERTWLSPLLEDFAAQVQSGSPPRRRFVGVATGEVAPGVEPPAIFFLCSQIRRFCRFSPVPSRAAGGGQPIPALPQNHPKSSLFIPRGSREETPTASFYQITPFTARFERGAPARRDPDYGMGTERTSEGEPRDRGGAATPSPGSPQTRGFPTERGGSAAPFPLRSERGRGDARPRPHPMTAMRRR